MRPSSLRTGPRCAQRARAAGVAQVVIPAVEVNTFDDARNLAHAGGDSYCLGIHPLYVDRALPDSLAQLDRQLQLHHADPRLVAIGEIGLDYFVPALTQSPLREKQEDYYRAQLKLARQYELPVVLHVRRSADRLLKHLRDLRSAASPWLGIAHAFNGSDVQALEFVKLGFKLGFGGAVTYERALQLRRLSTTLPLGCHRAGDGRARYPPALALHPGRSAGPWHCAGAQ